MAPALTKILKNGHGIHLSSPPASVRMDSDGRSSCSIEQEPHNRSLDSGSLQTMWQDLSSMCSLDSGLTSSLPDAPASPEFSPCLQASASQCEMESLVWLLSVDKDQRGSHQVGSVSPGGPGMFLVPVSEHNSQEVCVQHEQSAAPECGPDGGDVHHSSPSLTSVCSSYSSGGTDSQGSASLFANPATLTQEELPGMGCPRASQQPCTGQVDFDQPTFKAVLQEAVKDQLSRQAGLHERAWRLQRRLQGLVGEQAVQHCSQQLEGLKGHPKHGKVFLNSFDSTPPCVAPHQVSNKPHLFWQESSIDLSFFTDVSEFSDSSQLVLRELQEALDSEATASSSSDEESQEDRIGGKALPICSSSCEKQWLEERTELGSRWSWLQLRLAELDAQIQQQVQVYKHMRSNKVGVVLAESHPMTERQIQKTLMKEISGLTCTASDADTEPCSPTRLLRNIERQSAHLNEIVNSLMPPLSFSPLSKQPYTQKGKRAFTRGHRGDYLLLPESSKRRKLTARSLFKVDLSCVCARTRPLVSYRKPKLFMLSSLQPNSLLDSQSNPSTFLSSLSSPSCSCWSSCDPVNLCSNPDCGSSTTLSSKRSRSRNTLSSPTRDVPVLHNLQRVRGREQWYLRPLDIGSLAFKPSKHKRYNSTPLHNSRNYKQRARHHKNRLMGLSPIKLIGLARSQDSTANQKRRKRGNIHRGVEDEKDVLYQFYNPEENLYHVPEESYTHVPRKQTSQGFVHKRQGTSVYNINNVILPASLGKVEALQYKEILTPRWRIVDTESLLKTETQKKLDNEEEKAEDLSDEVFTRRHKALEQKEKSSWPHWGKTKGFMLSTSSGSGLSGSGGGASTSGGESSVESASAQLDSDEQLKSEEWLPQTYWDPREFPLDEAEEAALLSDVVHEVQPEWSEPSLYSSSKSPNPQHSPTQWCGATLPPGGQDEKCTLKGT